MLGFEVARFAYQTEAGWVGAGLVGFIAGPVGFGLLSVVFVSLRSPAARVIIGLIFALPAAGAGYMLIRGRIRDGRPVRRMATGLLRHCRASCRSSGVHAVGGSGKPASGLTQVALRQLDLRLGIEVSSSIIRHGNQCRFPLPRANRSRSPVPVLADPARPRRGMSDRRAAFGLARLPATAAPCFFPPPDGFAARSKKAGPSRPPLTFQPFGCGPVISGLTTAIEVAMGAARSAKGT